MSDDTTPREAEHPARAHFEPWHRSRDGLLFSKRQPTAFDRDDAGAYRHPGMEYDWQLFAAGYEAAVREVARMTR